MIAGTQYPVVLEEQLQHLSPDRRAGIGEAARNRVLAEHTFAHRAQQVDSALQRALAPQCASAS